MKIKHNKVTDLYDIISVSIDGCLIIDRSFATKKQALEYFTAVCESLLLFHA